MSNQINSGQTFSVDQLVTADKLNKIAAEATLRKGAITSQQPISGQVSSSDEVILADVSDSADHPKKTTVQNLLGSGVPIVASTVTTPSIESTDVLVVDAANGPLVSATYSSSGSVITVTSTAHGLLAGRFLEVSGASSASLNGTVKIVTASANTFTFSTPSAPTPATGTLIFSAKGTVAFNSNVTVQGGLQVDGDITVSGSVAFSPTAVLKLPSGTTGERPSVPEVGSIRFNTELQRPEIYDGSLWAEVSGGPFEATGGDYVIAPSKEVLTGCIASSTGGVVLTINRANHGIVKGQIVEVKFTSSSLESGEFACIDVVSTSQFKVCLHWDYGVISNAQCSIRKAGGHKIHVYKTPGNHTFTTGNKDGYAWVLLVGGGSPASGVVGHPGGGVSEVRSLLLKANTTYNVTVGAKGYTVGTTGYCGSRSTFNAATAPSARMLAAGTTHSVLPSFTSRGSPSEYVGDNWIHQRNQFNPANTRFYGNAGWVADWIEDGWNTEGPGAGRTFIKGAEVHLGDYYFVLPLDVQSTGYYCPILNDVWTNHTEILASNFLNSGIEYGKGGRPWHDAIPNSGQASGPASGTGPADGIVVIRYDYWV